MKVVLSHLNGMLETCSLFGVSVVVFPGSLAVSTVEAVATGVSSAAAVTFDVVSLCGDPGELVLPDESVSGSSSDGWSKEGCSAWPAISEFCSDLDWFSFCGFNLSLTIEDDDVDDPSVKASVAAVTTWAAYLRAEVAEVEDLAISWEVDEDVESEVAGAAGYRVDLGCP